MPKDSVIKTAQKLENTKRTTNQAKCHLDVYQSSIKEKSTRINRILLSGTIWEYCDRTKL